MRRLRVKQKANDLDTLDLSIEEVPSPPLTGSQVRVRVHAAGVNQSDVKATLGSMPKAVWPRTPGRDWAGVVEEGPADWKGAEVFGTGGDLGITRDGSHATELVLPADALTRRPSQLAMAEAGSLGVPFVTAWEGLYRAGMPAPGEVVLVLAVNGKVGQAAAQIAAMRGARVFGVTRGKESFAGNARVPVRMIELDRRGRCAGSERRNERSRRRYRLQYHRQPVFCCRECGSCHSWAAGADLHDRAHGDVRYFPVLSRAAQFLRG